MPVVPVVLSVTFALALGWHARCIVRPGSLGGDTRQRRVESVGHAVMAATMIAMLAGSVVDVPRAAVAAGVAVQVGLAILAAAMGDRAGVPHAGRGLVEVLVSRLADAAMALAMVAMLLGHGRIEVAAIAGAHLHDASGVGVTGQLVAALVVLGCASAVVAWIRAREAGRPHAVIDRAAASSVALAMAAAMLVHG